MTADRYAQLVATGLGARAARRLGLPRPARLRRREPGAPLLNGPALVVGVAGAPRTHGVHALLRAAGADVRADLADVPDGVRLGAVVLDATAVAAVADLEAVRALLAPAFARLGPSGRLLLVGTDPATAPGVEAAAAQQALEGITRSAGKEARAGATVNLLRVAAAADAAALASPVLFLLSARSAFVSGQVVSVAAPAGGAPAWSPVPLSGQVAVVTGAARGIGAAVVDVLAGAGAHVVAVDVPAAGAALAAVANRAGGTALQMDVTAPGAPACLVEHLVSRHGGADVVVHNAGTTRDRLLVHLDAQRWGAVLDVNLTAPLRLTRALLDAEGALRPGARLVAVSSTSGLAGTRGQTNYAASKAGVAGAVRALAPALAARGMTANAVAPGFIETDMTARMPLVAREVARRLSSLGQGGSPVDVAEAIAWLAEPASAGLNGQVVRVCGQLLVGA